MAAYETKVLSAPKVIVDGVVLAIVPNSCMVRLPGDAKVRAMSAGGGSVQSVRGINTESLLGHVKFELPATAQNVDRVRLWKQKMVNGDVMTVNVVEQGQQFAHTNMALTKDTELAMKADGNIPCEFEGDAMFGSF